MVRFNSMQIIPMGLNFSIGGKEIKPDAQGYLGYATPRIELDSFLFKSNKGGFAHIFENIISQFYIAHTDSNIGIDKSLSKSLFIFNSSMKPAPTLLIRGRLK